MNKHILATSITCILISALLSGCGSNINNLGSDIKSGFKGIFLKEETLKVGVKEAYITEDLDAKSKKIKKVKLNEEILVIGLKDNDYWYKVLTPKMEGYIPINAMINISVTNEAAQGLSKVWDFFKPDKTAQTANTMKEKGWTETEDATTHAKGYGKKKVNIKKKKNRYDEKYINKFFVSLSESKSENSIKRFRKQGGLN